jgi:hypothetical protein
MSLEQHLRQFHQCTVKGEYSAVKAWEYGEVLVAAVRKRTLKVAELFQYVLSLSGFVAGRGRRPAGEQAVHGAKPCFWHAPIGAPRRGHVLDHLAYRGIECIDDLRLGATVFTKIDMQRSHCVTPLSITDGRLLYRGALETSVGHTRLAPWSVLVQPTASLIGIIVVLGHVRLHVEHGRSVEDVELRNPQKPPLDVQ